MLFDIPFEVELSVCMGVACCGWPISSRVTLVGSYALVLQNNAPTSATSSVEITSFIMLDIVSINPLDSLVLLKNCVP